MYFSTELSCGKTKVLIMSESLHKNANKSRSNKLGSSTDKIFQITESQPEKLAETMVQKALKPLKLKIKELKADTAQLNKRQHFMSNRHDDLTKECNGVQQSNFNHKRDI